MNQTKEGIGAKNGGKVARTKKSSLPIPTTKKITNAANPTALKKRPISITASNERTPGKPAASSKAPQTADKMENPNASINSMTKRLKGVLAQGDVIRTHFDAFTVKEEQLVLLYNHLKTGPKWDYKAKFVKQEDVIKELRGHMSITLSEVKSVKEKCLRQESETSAVLRDCYEEFIDAVQTINSFHAQNTRLQQDYLKAGVDARTAASSLMQYKTENSPLRNRTKEGELRLSELATALTLEQGKYELASTQLKKVTREFSDLQEASQARLSAHKESSDSRMEQSVAVYRDEVATLKAEIKSQSCQAVKFSDQKDLLDSKKQELASEMLLAQSRLREFESSNVRYEKDIERYSAECDRLRESLTQKDADLRSTINSLQEIQRQANHEKTGIRQELSLCQARVQTLEEERLDSTSQLAAKREEVAGLGKELAQAKEASLALEGRVAQQEVQAISNRESVVQLEVERELRLRCEVREEAERRERIGANALLLATQSECQRTMREVEEKSSRATEALQAQMAALAAAHSASQEEVRHQSAVAAGLEMEVKQLHSELENASVNHESVEKLGKVTGELEVMRRKHQELTDEAASSEKGDKARCAEFEEKLRVGETMRRKLHNLVQELRGNVRVFARVRPFLPNDGLDMASLPEPTIAARGDMNSLRIARKGRTNEERDEDHAFTFDKVFGPSSTQETLFQEVSEFVQSALDGYNVCLFSYGQTGSGKTHTMQGSGSGSMRGVIPRAMQQVGMYKTELEAKGWEYKMEVSFIEIYNETIRDLLREGAEQKHEIKIDLSGGVHVTDVNMVSVDPNNVEQVEHIMEEAARHRSVGQTAMNERSSRSHSVFALHLKATNASQGTCLKGTLSLVDLAGSERLDRSGATGSQLKETVAINKSLSSLTDVFVAIGNKQSHIPFRNSKLTYLLQPALSGDGKTLMMVNLSPTEESFHESLCSLRLAKQINQCELGKPKKQVKEVKEVVGKGTMGTASSSSKGGGTPATPLLSASASRQMSASMNAPSAASASATPQMLSASLGRRDPTPASGVSKKSKK